MDAIWSCNPIYKTINLCHNLRSKHHGNNRKENFKSRKCGPMRSHTTISCFSESMQEECSERRHQVSTAPPRARRSHSKLQQALSSSMSLRRGPENTPRILSLTGKSNLIS